MDWGLLLDKRLQPPAHDGHRIDGYLLADNVPMWGSVRSEREHSSGIVYPCRHQSAAL